MTYLLSGNSVRRITASTHRGRNIVVEMLPELLVFRLKGMKTRYNLSIVGAFNHAVKIEALAQFKRKKAERETKRKMRREGLV